MKIGYSKKVTKNLGNYESLVIKINVEEDLQDDQTPDQLLSKLKDFVNAKIQEDLASHNQKNSKLEVEVSVGTGELKNNNSDFIMKTDAKGYLVQTKKNTCPVNNEQLLNRLRDQCVLLVKQDVNNRLKINSLLAQFGVSKVFDLRDNQIDLFKRTLEAL
jgi:hypothetical protein